MEVSLQTKFKDAISALHFHLIWKSCSVAAMVPFWALQGHKKKWKSRDREKPVWLWHNEKRDSGVKLWEHLELFHSVFLLWAFIHRIPVGCFSCGFNRIHTAQQDEENKTWSPACQWLSGRKTQRIWKPSNESKFWKRLENWATPFPPSTRNELFTNNFIMLVYCSLVLNYYF